MTANSWAWQPEKIPLGPLRAQLQLCLTVFHPGKLRWTGKSGSVMVCRCGHNCLNLFSKHLFGAYCMPNSPLATGIRGINCTWHHWGTCSWWEKADVTVSVLRDEGMLWSMGEWRKVTSNSFTGCSDVRALYRGPWWQMGKHRTLEFDINKSILQHEKRSPLGKEWFMSEYR